MYVVTEITSRKLEQDRELASSWLGDDSSGICNDVYIKDRLKRSTYAEMA
jgi:hypothetical protein